ncbi:MAG: glycogen/starch synthase [Muribaculaceae bacterium]|nr:glycogen/starch synthase [Muribaculaceae bacterium]
MAVKKILFVNQEIHPYLPANEISSLNKTLPQSLHGKGYEVRTFMPKFGSVNERRNQLHEVIRLSGLNIEINDNDHPLILKVASMQPARIQVYFIDNDDYFTKLDSDIDVFGSNREDNDERAIYFARGTMETVKKLRWEPEFVQISGWISALSPAYMRLMTKSDGLFENSKIIYCVEPHNPDLAPFNPEILRKLKEDGIDPEYADKFADEKFDVNTLHKMAIELSHGVVFLTDEPDPEILAFVEEKGIPYITKETAQKGKPEFIELYAKIAESK